MNENKTLNVNIITTFLSFLTSTVAGSLAILLTGSLNTMYLSARTKLKKMSMIKIKTIHSINKYSSNRYDY